MSNFQQCIAYLPQNFLFVKNVTIRYKEENKMQLSNLHTTHYMQEKKKMTSKPVHSNTSLHARKIKV